MRIVALLGCLFLTRPSRAETPPVGPSISVQGGAHEAALGVEVDLMSSSRWFVGLGPSVHVFPSFQLGGRVGYHLPLSRGWGFRPGLRFDYTWAKDSICTCRGPSFAVDLALRYQSSSGFVLELGVPALLLAKGSNARDQTELEPFFFPTTAIVGSVFVGYAFGF
jgi:hypothetical protein